jgi:hypothetical protein
LPKWVVIEKKYFSRWKLVKYCVFAFFLYLRTPKPHINYLQLFWGGCKTTHPKRQKFAEIDTPFYQNQVVIERKYKILRFFLFEDPKTPHNSYNFGEFNLQITNQINWSRFGLFLTVL